jgi:Holliday junction resolvasome RuvABC endonuclease subunit
MRMPETERDLLDAMAGTFDGPVVAAALERVWSSPQMGVVSAFSFGRNYGALRVAMTACRIPFDEVLPQRWQKALGCLSRGDKNATKRRAQDLFPSAHVTHAIADALLLAEYCRRMHVGC